MEVDIREAKTHLCRLLARVASGEEITIAKQELPLLAWFPSSLSVDDVCWAPTRIASG
jgi:hypothetical protein